MEGRAELTPRAPAPVFATDSIKKEDVMVKLSKDVVCGLSVVVSLATVALGCGTNETLLYAEASGAGGSGGTGGRKSVV